MVVILLPQPSKYGSYRWELSYPVQFQNFNAVTILKIRYKRDTHRERAQVTCLPVSIIMPYQFGLGTFLSFFLWEEGKDDRVLECSPCWPKSPELLPALIAQA